jgi:cardiolipin synthase
MTRILIRHFGVLLTTLVLCTIEIARASTLNATPLLNNSNSIPLVLGHIKATTPQDPTPWLMGNTQVSEGFYENSKAPVIYDLIKSAHSTIDIEIYEMNDPEIRRLLKDAMQRSVRIRILKDPTPMGSQCSLFTPSSSQDSEDCLAQKSLVSELRSHGHVFEAFNKDALCGEKNKPCFEHGKMAIFDQSKALISTGNFDITNLCNLPLTPRVCNRDYTYITQDSEVIQTLKTIFENDLKGQSYSLPLLLTQKVRQKLTISPFAKKDILAFIQSAKTSIHIANQYLNETDLNQALIDAATRGVQVYILVASACSFGKPDEGAQNKLTQIYSSFDRAGIQSRFFTHKILINGRPGYMHAKAIVVDEQRAWIGSINGSMTAFHRNREFGIFFDDANSVKALVQSFKQDFGHSETESWQESLACYRDGT